MITTEQAAGLFAPTGTLRASINIGNPVLARRNAPADLPYGVSIDMAKALAERLGVGIEFIVFDSASQSVDAVANGQADVGFFAVDPKRGESIQHAGLRFQVIRADSRRIHSLLVERLPDPLSLLPGDA